MIGALIFYGAFDGETLVGIIATRNAGNHIALFFVDGKYHRQGIGRELFKEVLRDNTTGEITVHSSPYAVEVYRHLGFIALDRERVTDGITEIIGLDE
jgi:GNAT superfamily N-acetyltransferase